MLEEVTTADYKGRTTYLTRGEVLEQLLSRGLHVYATGSRVTTHFDPGESDYDYVILDTEDWSNYNNYIEVNGWVPGESGNQYSEFLSVKSYTSDMKVINLIFVREKSVFMKYVMATNLIRKVDPETKEERIALFDIIFKNNEAPF